MGVSVIALMVFITIIVCWNVLLKRNIAEAMLVGLVATSLFGGGHAPELLLRGLRVAATTDVLYASITFVFMAYLIDRTGIINRLVAILNSILGRLPGGAAYVSTVASALIGALSGSNSANTATCGAITVPWMVQSSFRREVAATIQAGNGGLGAAIPPSASMFLMLGFAPIAAVVAEGDLYVALSITGLYQIVHRVVVVYYFVKRDKVKAIAPEFVRPFGETLAVGWTSTLIFLGALIPIVVTIGPLAERLAANPHVGELAMKTISLITWIPVLIIIISLAVGLRRLPRSVRAWSAFLDEAAPMMSIGAVLVFAFAASEVLSALGLGRDLGRVLSTIRIPPLLMAMVVGLLITVIAGPLSSVATLAATGMVAFAALTSAGIEPLRAVAAILIFASTEAASPPASGSIFIASSLAGAQPEKTFVPLIVYYVIPIYVIGCLVAVGGLPVP